MFLVFRVSGLGSKRLGIRIGFASGIGGVTGFGGFRGSGV